VSTLWSKSKMTDQNVESLNPSKCAGGNMLQELRNTYKNYQNSYADDPFVSPVFRLAMQINTGIEKQDISVQQISDVVKKLTKKGLTGRAANIARYLGACSVQENTKKIDTLFESLILGTKKEIKTFKSFKQKVEQLFYGFVFTAHPTFTMTQELSQTLSGYAAQCGGAENNVSLEALYEAADLSFSPPDIDDENELSLYAIDNLHLVIEKMLERLFIVAAKYYPNQWQELQPKLFSIATWVGFDVDGRRDISWATTLEKRIFLQLRQLQAYQKRFLILLENNPKSCANLKISLDHLKFTVTELQELHQAFAQYKQGGDENLEQLQALSRRLIKSADKRLLSAHPLIENVKNILQETTSDALKIQLMMILAQLQNFGLSRAEVHFRINSAQLHNAISDRIQINTHPDHPTKRRQYIDEINDAIKNVTPTNIDFGDIAEEKITAKYEFMLIQKIVQYIDNDSPIRFLIAETESAFTILTALYYAKKFGVDHKIDICPLFETDQALQDSSRYMNALLAIPSFTMYLKQRGKLCIQTGYSDAGRYIGQPAAGASIERLKERFIHLFGDQKLQDISLLFFDTHGESIGRGGHPESFHKRMQYIASPYVLSQTVLHGVSYTQESSYQGGDGFLNFMTEETALAVLTRTLEYWLDDYAEVKEDPYYQEPYRSDVTRFFTESTRFQLSLTHDPQYADMLFAFSGNMMKASGSRAVIRQRTPGTRILKKQAVTDIRAIPTNAILGQMGLLANTISGMGRAMREDAEFSETMAQKSPRFQTVLSLVNSGASLSNPQIMRAYINVLDPTLWITQANACKDDERSNYMASIATHLEQHDFHDGMMEVYRKLSWDYTLLERFEPIQNHENEVDIACLHALRIALIQHVFVNAISIPRYSPRHAVTREDLLKIIFHMDIENAVNVLDAVFPARILKTGDYNFGEKSDYRKDDEADGYRAIQKNIVKPMREVHKVTQDISTALAHFIGFFG